jgi:hypothetical protein
MLARFVVQLARNPAPFLLLRLKHPFGQQPMRRLRLLQLGNLLLRGFRLLALSDVSGNGGRPDHVAVWRLKWRHGHGDIDDGPVFPPTLRLVVRHRFAAPNMLHDCGHFVFGSRWQ